MSDLPAYRAWHKAEQRMYRVTALYLGRLEQGISILREDGPFLMVKPDEVELMQRLPLMKDKHGKEIFEGDFLRVDWKDSRYPTHIIGPVSWDIENACWSVGEGGSPKHDAENYMEVIGNLYEDPDLLKKSESGD